MNPNNVPEPSMTVAEARKVKWNKPNPRPIGELLDEGKLTTNDLIWAADRAFNPLLKQASRVLLDQLDHDPLPQDNQPKPIPLAPEVANSSFSINLTMEQARATEWPFHPYKGQPMGILADKQQLSLKELANAVDIAWDQRVRHAAKALLLFHLNQALQEPPPSAGMLHVTSGGRSFAQRRESLLIFAEAAIIGGVLGALLVVVIVLIIQSIVFISTSTKTFSTLTTPPNIVVGVIISIGLSFVMNRLFVKGLDRISKHVDKEIAGYRKGHEGEERVVSAMHAVLDGNWHLFRNIVLPGRNQGDLDLVLVGPSGVWVLEIKTLTGTYRNIGEQWEYQAGKRWMLNKKSPSRQANDNAIRFANFLKADGIQQWVTPAIIWANPESPLQVENPSVAVWPLDRLMDELGNIWQEETLPQPKRQQIIEKLSKLCHEMQKAREQMTS